MVGWVDNRKIDDNNSLYEPLGLVGPWAKYRVFKKIKKDIMHNTGMKLDRHVSVPNADASALVMTHETSN